MGSGRPVKRIISGTRGALIGTMLIIPAFAFAGEFTGKVVGVINGDSIRVMHEGKAEQVRLNGIDCPEKGQAF